MYIENRRPWFGPLLGLISAICLAMTVVCILIFDDWFSPLVYLPTGLLMAVLARTFGGYLITASESGITFGYRGWKVSLQRDQIVSIEAVEVRWLQWGGLGWRIRGGDRIGYIVHSGPGVEITTISGRRYTINAERPAELADLFKT